MARPLSENGKVLVMCILFPIFWPFIPVLLLCFACESIRDAYRRRKYRLARRAPGTTEPSGEERA